jgi:GT2 family glycosyltransferase
VIDNASTDETKGIIGQYTNEYENFQYAFEGKVGLSRARNTGWLLADTVWVGYLDDDAKAPEDFVEHALHLIANYDFDCFGGTYYAWYKYGKPKWLLDSYVEKEILYPRVCLLSEGEYLSGGIFFCKRRFLECLKGFNLNLGMTDKVGYGEEDDFQRRLRLVGGRIGYDPSFHMNHCVLPYKLTLNWYLKRSYMSGRSSYVDYSNEAFLINLYWLFRTLAVGIFRLPIKVYKVFFHDRYYWQNMVLESTLMPLKYLGAVFILLKFFFSLKMGRPNKYSF